MLRETKYLQAHECQLLVFCRKTKGLPIATLKPSSIMMQKRPRLPIGIQSFEIIREQDYLYVDKTSNIYRMVDEGMFYFLSRPRRFGKSLLISTIRCLFQGRHELFEELWIEQQTNWEWKSYPVVLIDFNQITHDTPENLKLGLEHTLLNLARKHSIGLEEPLLTEQFRQLMVSLHQKIGMPVVILIDEYDKPIIDHLGKGNAALEIAKANRDILKNFFGVLKGGEVAPILRFVFLTGISKFNKVSIFSELNNLRDISMVDAYSDLCGYTQEELQHCFPEHLRAFEQKLDVSSEAILEQLADQYNGYCFSKKGISVYNPFSVLNAFQDLSFENYWFETGSPTLLINALKARRFDLSQIEQLELPVSRFSTYELETLDPNALLFQTGYVTIKGYEEGLYTLGYPNQEVKMAFLDFLLNDYTEANGATAGIMRLMKYLRNEQLDDFFECLDSMFAAIPYVLSSQQDESYFHTAFYLMVAASGGAARNEVLTSRGRIDMLIEFPDKLFILEFKCNQSAKAALNQIERKGYATPFRQQGKKLICLGINFSTDTRSIAEWDQISLT